MSSELDAKITLWSAFGIFIFLVLIKLGNHDLFKEIPALISWAITITVTIRHIFFKWAWKWSIFKVLKMIHRTPLLEGIWDADLESTGNENMPDGRRSLKVKFQITQPSIKVIKVKRISDEGQSSSFGESIIENIDGSFELIYSYFSETKAIVRSRSPLSFGTAKLKYSESLTESLDGNYWTDQKTTGTLRLVRSAKV